MSELNIVKVYRTLNEAQQQRIQNHKASVTLGKDGILYTREEEINIAGKGTKTNKLVSIIPQETEKKVSFKNVTAADSTNAALIVEGGTLTKKNLYVSSSNNVISYTDDTGALNVAGGARIGKDTWISGSLNVAGDFTVFGSSSVVCISSSTVIINDNIIQLNAYVPYERYAGFEVYDSGSNQRSASLLWDGDQDNWMTVDQNNSASNIIIGPTASFGNTIQIGRAHV